MSKNNNIKRELANFALKVIIEAILQKNKDEDRPEYSTPFMRDEITAVTNGNFILIGPIYKNAPALTAAGEKFAREKFWPIVGTVLDEKNAKIQIPFTVDLSDLLSRANNAPVYAKDKIRCESCKGTGLVDFVYHYQNKKYSRELDCPVPDCAAGFIEKENREKVESYAFGNCTISASGKYLRVEDLYFVNVISKAIESKISLELIADTFFKFSFEAYPGLYFICKALDKNAGIISGAKLIAEI